MIDEKSSLSPQPQVEAPPPTYNAPHGAPPLGYGPPPQAGPGYGPPQGYGASPTGSPQAYPTQPGPFTYPQQVGYGPAPVPGQQQYYYGAPPPGAGYPPQAAPPVQNVGAQYQEQLLAMCASGNHDVQKKHGIAGIIAAILFFPIGLLCLVADVEKRCVRCGAHLG
ncbi:hypothetical protein GY45DRAFT_1316525 [Cubamyces sp. BRFM 1775]|nr:hypothetical protein GY45DRAFT_1316525 [Cubamyces sp. BRFM 1775]